MSSPYFSLKDFTFEHYNPLSVVLEYPFLSKLINKMSRGWTDPNQKSHNHQERRKFP